MHEILDDCAQTVKFVKLHACGEHMVPLSFTVKLQGVDGQAQIMPNQSVKATYVYAADASLKSNFDYLASLI